MTEVLRHRICTHVGPGFICKACALRYIEARQKYSKWATVRNVTLPFGSIQIVAGAVVLLAGVSKYPWVQWVQIIVGLATCGLGAYAWRRYRASLEP